MSQYHAKIGVFLVPFLHEIQWFAFFCLCATYAQRGIEIERNNRYTVHVRRHVNNSEGGEASVSLDGNIEILTIDAISRIALLSVTTNAGKV